MGHNIPGTPVVVGVSSNLIYMCPILSPILGYNGKSITYKNHSGKRKINADDLKYQHQMALEWYQYINTF